MTSSAGTSARCTRTCVSWPRCAIAAVALASALEAVLQAYALIQHEHSEGELAAQLHQGPHMEHAHEHLRGFIGELMADGAVAGALRDDVPADELAAFCQSALAGAGRLPSKAAVGRLVAVVLDGLRPPG